MGKTDSDLWAKSRQMILAQGEKSLRRLEKLIARFSLVGDAAFFDRQQFDWVPTLEANWLTIRQELDGVLKNVNQLPNFQDISTDQSSITQDQCWKTYFFYAYGIKAENNCKQCPATTRMIEQIPGMKTAFFSILLPHKQIPEHRGPYKGVIRYHLGLRVPQPYTDCGIRVNHEIRHWQEGKSLIFDDTFPHAAWNRTEEIRVVLFLDVIRPMQFPFSLLNRSILQLIIWSPYIQSNKPNFQAWDDRLKQVFSKDI